MYLDRVGSIKKARKLRAFGILSCRICDLLAVHFATDATTAVDDLAATLGLHASAETDRTAAFDVADSSWVVHCHGQISIRLVVTQRNAERFGLRL